MLSVRLVEDTEHCFVGQGAVRGDYLERATDQFSERVGRRKRKQFGRVHSHPRVEAMAIMRLSISISVEQLTVRSSC